MSELNGWPPMDGGEKTREELLEEGRRIMAEIDAWTAEVYGKDDPSKPEFGLPIRTKESDAA